MERFVPFIQAVFDEGVEDAVMLVHAVEERADVTVPAVESARSNLQRSVVAFHASPPSGDRRMQRAEPVSPCHIRRLLLRVRRAAGERKSSIADLRRGSALHGGSTLRGCNLQATPNRPNGQRSRLGGDHDLCDRAYVSASRRPARTLSERQAAAPTEIEIETPSRASLTG